MKKTQKGFGALEGLLIIVIAGLIAAMGYYVMVANNNADQSLTNADSSSDIGAKVNGKKSSTSTKSTVSASYLEIKEWGVKLKLADNIKDATYRFEKPSDPYAYLNTKKLDEVIAKNPGCEGAKEYYAINRVQPGDPFPVQPATKEDLDKNATKVGEYYYYVQRGNGIICDEDKVASVPQEIQDIHKALAGLGRTTEKL